MQELIEIIKKRKEDDDAMPFMYNDRIIELAESLLEKEKEVIETAFLEGRILRPLDSEQWYNVTFNTKER